MKPALHSTADYHRGAMKSLGWELTVCNMLEAPESPCRSILEQNDSYGSILYDFLTNRLPMERIRAVLEIGGGYGFLMRDFLGRNPRFTATMLDISPFLLHRQRETLQKHEIVWIEEDFLSSDLCTLEGFGLAVLNENLGDFPTVSGLTGEWLAADDGGTPRWALEVRRLFDRYSLPEPTVDPFAFNLGAVKAVEKLCSAGIPYLFIGEHSCEAAVPDTLRSFITVQADGFPQKIPLHGHDEYTVKFSHLERVARVLGYNVVRGPFADYLRIDWTERLRSVLRSSGIEITGSEEALRQFVGDLYQYEYLLLARKEDGKLSKPPQTDCDRCGKCCLADFIAYVRDEDMERWQREGRTDILRMIRHEHALWMGDHLVCADDGRYLHGCPFLAFEQNRFRCSIYETRPRICREYQPASSEICPKFQRRGGPPAEKAS